ncbi:hypothetical protein [Streptomyces sp. CS62]|uniref:hypothetical protein n=1 Tax=Streptomyces sp. CS62 TaxID=3119268 RepID=UPI002F942F6E
MQVGVGRVGDAGRGFGPARRLQQDVGRFAGRGQGGGRLLYEGGVAGGRGGDPAEYHGLFDAGGGLGEDGRADDLLAVGRHMGAQGLDVVGDGAPGARALVDAGGVAPDLFAAQAEPAQQPSGEAGAGGGEGQRAGPADRVPPVQADADGEGGAEQAGGGAPVPGGLAHRAHAGGRPAVDRAEAQADLLQVGGGVGDDEVDAAPYVGGEVGDGRPDRLGDLVGPDDGVGELLGRELHPVAEGAFGVFLRAGLHGGAQGAEAGGQQVVEVGAGLAAGG